MCARLDENEGVGGHLPDRVAQPPQHPRDPQEPDHLPAPPPPAEAAAVERGAIEEVGVGSWGGGQSKQLEMEELRQRLSEVTRERAERQRQRPRCGGGVGWGWGGV